MKILVFSDTHGKINSAIKIISSYKEIDMIIHLGDLVRDAKDLESIFGIKTEYVSGNNDYFEDVPYEKSINLSGKKIFLTHGHKYKVKYEIESLLKKGKEEKADIILFGHTHQPYEQVIDNILCLNPGSITLPRKKPSYGLIEIMDNKICSMTCTIKKL